MNGTTLYTVGHSNRSLDELLTLLAEVGIQVLVDVRSQPHSSRFPHFSEPALRAAVAAQGITYHWAGRQLGGRRESAVQSPHVGLDEGLRGYADYMQGDAFQRAASQLVNMAARAPTVLLCAERLPEDCHRGLISDYLTLQGMQVIHLLGPGEQRAHQLHPALRRESAALVYDRAVSGALDL